MTAGAIIPAITLFHDGNAYYIADGFHRFMAAQRVEWREIDADVMPGAKADALWFALGANRTNAKNMTPEDKRHAIVLALKTWPERSGRQIAEQVGCGLSYLQRIKDEVTPRVHLDAEATRVIGKDGKSYPASRRTAKPVEASTMPARGQAKANTKATQDERWTRAREMASEGYTSRQMADEFGVGVEGLRVRLREHGIDVPADRVIGKSHHIDATRIIEQMVMDAEHLTADVNLFDLDDLPPARIPEWIASLNRSKKLLESFIRQLM
jgi:hypothetical protein